MESEILDKFITLVTSAFGFVAALAWNNAVKALFESYFSVGTGLKAMFIYALFVSITAIFIIYFLAKANEKVKKIEIKQYIRKRLEN